MQTSIAVTLKDTDTTFQIRFKKDLYAKASKLAQSRGISLAGLIRMLLIAELNKDQPPSA